MKGRPRDPGAALLLGGAVALATLAAVQLPAPRELTRRPNTPYDRAQTASAAPAFLFLSEAAQRVPAGAIAAVRSEPRSAADETMLHFLGVALLPGRRVLPAAAWSQFTPEYEAQAEYILVIGPRPAPGRAEAEGLRLVFSNPRGSLWRRSSP